MNLFPSPSAGFDDPLEVLDACHDRVRRFSDLAIRIAQKLQASGVDADVRAAAQSVIRYFDEAGPNHHRDEEDDLFPILAAHAPDVVARLRGEHRALEALWADVRKGLETFTLDVPLAQSFAHAYRAHIAFEEAEMLPLARRVLDERQVAQLGASMAKRRGVAR